MPLFKYIAKQSPNKTFEEVIEAASKEEALEKISKNGIYPVKIEEIKKDLTSSFPKIKDFRIRYKDITLFTRQFSILLRSGVQLLSALNILKNQSRNQRYRQMLADIHTKVKTGVDLSESLKDYPKIFGPFYVAMVQAGETSGTLEHVLSRISEHRKRMEEIFSHVRSALAYPVLISIVGIGTVVYMLTSVMPRLFDIFSGLDRQLPLSTRMMINISDFLLNWGLWLLIFLAVLILLMKRFLSRSSGRRFWSRLQTKIPLLGNFLIKIELMRFSRTLEILVKSGIPILKALEVTIPVLNNELIKERLVEARQALKEGGSFAASLKPPQFFPEFMVNLLLVGEESGRLGESLNEIGNAYERETEESIKVMVSLIEPLMILVMGVVVGFIVFSMLLPLFDITAGIG